MRFHKGLLVLAALSSAALPASAQTITLSLLADINMNGTVAATALPTSVGSRISAVAWDGTNLYVGGYNQTGATANVGVVAITNALTNPTLGTPFAPIASIGDQRGYSELAIQNGELAASVDSGGSSGIAQAAYTALTGSFLWSNGSGNGNSAASLALRGNGVAFDPGYIPNGGQVGSGTSPSNGTVGTLTIGSGRRIALNGATGTYVYSQSGGPTPNGAVINFTGSNGVTSNATFWRSLAFDPTTGNMYARNENVIIKMVRGGDNVVTSSTLLAGSGTSGNPFFVATNVDNQNLAFVNSTAYGNFIIANDHSSNASNQNPANILRAVDPNNINNFFTLSFSNTLPNGVGAYNFSFDPTSQTLALSDFGNNQVYIYHVGPTAGAATPEPVTLALALSGAGLALAAIRRRHSQYDLQD